MKKTITKKVKKRKYVRFPSDVGAQAFVLTDDEGLKLKTPLPALVVEESYKGCSLIVLKNAIFYEGSQVKVKVGRLDAMVADIKWVKTYDNKVTYLGLIYLD